VPETEWGAFGYSIQGCRQGVGSWVCLFKESTTRSHTGGVLLSVVIPYGLP